MIHSWLTAEAEGVERIYHGRCFYIQLAAYFWKSEVGLNETSEFGSASFQRVRIVSEFNVLRAADTVGLVEYVDIVVAYGIFPDLDANLARKTEERRLFRVTFSAATS